MVSTSPRKLVYYVNKLLRSKIFDLGALINSPTRLMGQRPGELTKHNMHYSNDPKKPQQHHNDQSNEPLAQQNPPQSQHEVMRQRHHSQHNHQKQHSLIAIKETVGALVVWNQLS